MRLIKKEAFTLIEVMVSVAILSIGLVLILQGLARSLNILRIVEDNMEATFTAENKMAESDILAKEDWDDYESGLSDSFESEDIEYDWKIEVKPVVWDSADLGLEEIPEIYQELNEVSASLSWKEGKRNGEVIFSTYARSKEESDAP